MNRKGAKLKESKAKVSFGVPLMADKIEKNNLSVASFRRNRAGTSEMSDAFYHIENGVDPFQESNNGSISISDAISLCQKAYYNFSIYRNTIDIMTEFSTNKIYYRGGNKKSRDFFEAFWNRNNIMSLQGMFYREYYRSSNVVIHRLDAILDSENIGILNKIFGATAADGVKLPVKYVILNPCDIVVAGNITFFEGQYMKRLSPYEVQRLSNPQTPEEVEYFNSLPPEVQKEIKQAKNGTSEVLVPLDPKKTYVIFYNKQDYEPLAVPMGYPVLRDINWKAEMKMIDMAVARTTQRAILLIKMGYESKDGNYNFDQKAAEAMQKLFENESVGKVLVADFTTEAEFVIPSIGDLLDPKKYEIVNEDIRMGLNNILMGKDEKFANQFIAVQLFIQRLEQAREVFLNEFLIPEIKRISRIMGFKNYPTPYFEEIDLKDQAEFSRIVSRLGEVGILTPWETVEALESGRMPTKEESLEAQEELRGLKDKGYYEPLVGGPYTTEKIAQLGAETKMATSKPAGTSGRPTGTKRKQSTKKIKPLGASETTFSLTKVKDNLLLASELNKAIEETLSKKHNVEKLNKEQIEFAHEIGEVIIANEEAKDWKSSIDKYLENPAICNQERLNKIDEIAYTHQVDSYLASILLASIKE